MAILVPAIVGKEPSDENKKLHLLAESLAQCSHEAIAPYFQKYFGEVPMAEVMLISGAEKNFAFMSCAKYEGGNYIGVYAEALREMITFFRKDRGEKIYAGGLFLHAITHEIVHLLRPEKFWSNRDCQKWSEGAAYVFSWLILSDFYQNTKNELSFWRTRKQPQDMVEAILKKNLRLGMKRVIALKNYEHHLALSSSRISYRLPDFLPKSIKNLFAYIVKNDVNFPVGISRETIARLKEGDKELLRHCINCAEGIIVINYLLKNKLVSPKELAQQPIANARIDEIFQKILNKELGH